jgi:hypothetical protein
MERYTQAQFSSIPRDARGIRHCPLGDYSQVIEFGAYNEFGDGNEFSIPLPAPTQLLLQSWDKVSDELCCELMRFDADNHENPALFDIWARGGNCPYDNAQFKRCANFKERKEAWRSGKCTISESNVINLAT